jgi:hypothetical protein
MKTLFVHPLLVGLNSTLESIVELEREAQRKYNHYHTKMVDLQHEIEMSKDYTEEMIIDLYFDLKAASLDRRKWKDTLILIENLRANLQKGIDIETLNRVLSNASDGWSRNYTPRVLKEMDFKSPETLFLSRQKKIEDERSKHLV